MNPLKYIYILFVACCFLPAGCNKEDMDGMGEEKAAVQFVADNTALLRTTTDGERWQPGDDVGIFMVKSGQTLSAASIAENAGNMNYQASQGSTQSRLNPVSGHTIYYPVDGSMVDFIAYYPYRPQINGYTYPVDVGEQGYPAAIDVLYSDNVKAQNKKSGPVNLEFNHVLSKISFTLEAGEGSPSLAGVKVELTNMVTTADISLAGGNITPTNSGQTIAAHTAADGSSSSAILIPGSYSNVKMIITLPDNLSVFEYSFADTEFIPGMNHPYHIKVNKTGINVSIGNITIWIGVNDPQTPGQAKARCKIGDYYPDPNVDLTNPEEKAKIQGIVFWLDPDAPGYDDGSTSGGIASGFSGKIVSLDNVKNIKWAAFVNDYMKNTTEYDGLVNMQAIATYIHNNNKSWDDFPAFQWVHDNKNGGNADYNDINAKGVWYIPSFNELAYFFCTFNDKPFEIWAHHQKPSWGANNVTANAAFNKKLTDAGGSIIDTNTEDFYWSSSERDGNNYYILVVNFATGFRAGLAREEYVSLIVIAKF